jgi:hypothetical protein
MARREGRCALSTSFAAFKYMILYPVIQLTQAITLYQGTHMHIDLSLPRRRHRRRRRRRFQVYCGFMHFTCRTVVRWNLYLLASRAGQ